MYIAMEERKPIKVQNSKLSTTNHIIELLVNLDQNPNTKSIATSHENHMQESFEVRPFRFLVKPVSEKQIESCFKSAYEEVYCEDSYFRYSYQRVNHKIPMREILYFESNKRKVFIVTEKGTFVAYAKLNDIEESLKQSKVPFLRVHQSYLVNYKHVEGQAYDFVVMDNSKKISISEDRRKLIGEQYCSMEDTIYVGE